jgi:hypothetical protein
MLVCLLLAQPMHDVSNIVFILPSQGASPKPAAGPGPGGLVPSQRRQAPVPVPAPAMMASQWLAIAHVNKKSMDINKANFKIRYSIS